MGSRIFTATQTLGPLWPETSLPGTAVNCRTLGDLQLFGEGKFFEAVTSAQPRSPRASGQGGHRGCPRVASKGLKQEPEGQEPETPGIVVRPPSCRRPDPKPATEVPPVLAGQGLPLLWDR